MASGYFRFPTIHGETIVFVCEDDLWSVPVGGGEARRLTSNLGEVSHPYLSPDGKHIAFVGREEGLAEIYVMPAQGGIAKRLTFMGGTIVTTAGWTNNNEIIFVNNAEHWYLRSTFLYTVNLAGDYPTKLNYGPARSIAFGPVGGIVLGRNNDDPARWKRYRGGTVGQFWVDKEGAGNFQRILSELEANMTSPMWLKDENYSGRIYFISDHEGISNLYSCLPDGEDIKRHSDHQDFYIRNANTDGRRIVYHAGGELYYYDVTSRQVSHCAVEFHSPRVQRNRKFVNSSKYLESWQLHPKGHSLAVATRGQVFSFANWEGAVTGPIQPEPDSEGTAIRTRLPRFLNDGQRIIAVTDRGGEESFVILNASAKENPVILEELDIGRPDNMAVSPKKDQIVFSNHRYEIHFLDLETLEMKRIDKGVSYPIMGLTWSPDGNWVAYSVSISLQRLGLKLWNVNSNESTLLADPVLRDVAPSFDPQGKYLYFLSYRQFNPVYDSLQFDLGFPYGMRPYLVTLQKDQISPFSPRLIEEESKNDEEGEDENGDGEKDQPMQLDLDGISERVLAFPVPEGRYGRIMGSKDGKPLYTRYPVEGVLNRDESAAAPQAKGVLYLYDFEEQKEEKLIDSVTDFQIGRNGKTLIYRSKNKLRVLKAGEKPEDGTGNTHSKKAGWIDLSRVKVSIEPGAEWRQMYREAWRLQRDNFWTEDMSKVDWISVHNRYISLLDKVASRSEFSDLMWEMQGELGTSHAYEFGGDYRVAPQYGLGYLGARYQFNRVTSNWEIVEILKGDSWDVDWASPLSATGVNVMVGDKLLAINGIRLNENMSPNAALVNMAGQEVTLTILPAEEEKSRLVTVKTLNSEGPVMYRQWVSNNREIVHKLTNGRVGYIHIPDMAGPGYSEFHRGFLTEVEREALIVDERYNRGGHVSGLLLQKLARRRVAFGIDRWSEVAEPYPSETIDGPMVALVNEFAGSDGDIFAHAFKLLGLGPVIGKRTWGGVVGIWPRHLLVDGTVTTQPEFAFWFDDVGWGVENYGTDPDIEVDISPQDYIKGQDPQLGKAIEEILKALAEKPPMQTDFSERPILSLPKLPVS
jgi:tricorn protease